MKTLSTYDIRVLAVATGVWGYACSWAFAKHLWDPIIDLLHVSPPTLAFIFGISIIMLCMISTSVLTFHLFCSLSPRRRQRFKVGMISHLSAGALAWMAVGGIIFISTRTFPYLTSPTDEGNKSPIHRVDTQHELPPSGIVN